MLPNPKEDKQINKIYNSLLINASVFSTAVCLPEDCATDALDSVTLEGSRESPFVARGLSSAAVSCTTGSNKVALRVDAPYRYVHTHDSEIHDQRRT
jgi:hypothetical protein